MSMSIKPEKLHIGDTVGIISPSWNGAYVYPTTYKKGLHFLVNKLKLKIIEFPSTKKTPDFLRKNPQYRAEDLQSAFTNSNIKAIFTCIGGDDSIRILPYLEKSVFTKNHKILLGFSDITTLHLYLNQLGLVTFYGPTIMAGFAQSNNFGETYYRHINDILFSNSSHYNFKHFDKYCHGYPDWSNNSNADKVNRLIKNKGWIWLNKSKNVVQGKATGGCFEVLEMIKATSFWPRSEFWSGKILLLETSENKPSLNWIDHAIRNYGMQGIFNHVSAIVIGRLRGYSQRESATVLKKVKSIIVDEFNATHLNIIANFDFGHTDPQFIIPLGVKVLIDPIHETLVIDENWLY